MLLPLLRPSALTPASALRLSTCLAGHHHLGSARSRREPGRQDGCGVNRKGGGRRRDDGKPQAAGETDADAGESALVFGGESKLTACLTQIWAGALTGLFIALCIGAAFIAVVSYCDPALLLGDGD